MERHIAGAITQRNVRATSGGLLGLLWFFFKPPSHHNPAQYGGYNPRTEALTPAQAADFRRRAAAMFPAAYEAGKAAALAAEEAHAQHEDAIDLKAAAERGRQQAREDIQRILRSP